MFKENGRLIIGIFIGVILMGGVSYAVNSFTSESVSYTRNGQTMNVKQALDDLIVKVDKKSGNFNIELTTEQTVVKDKTVDAMTYKTMINSVIDKMISAMGSTAKMAELTALKNATSLTWASENTTIASVTNNTTVKGVKVGTTRVIGTTSNGKQVIVPVNVKSASYLAVQANVGDYVVYNAGKWDSSANNPTEYYAFGEYKQGQSKNASVEWCSDENNKTTLKGWRVLSKDTNSKTVTIIHAGQPECYRHNTYTYSNAGDESVARLNLRAKNQYLNATYAQSARSMTKADLDTITPESNTLRKTGEMYWLANANSGYLWYVTTYGTFVDGYSGTYSYGFRPVIVLKQGMLTTGKVKDEFNQDAWSLVLPS